MEVAMVEAGDIAISGCSSTTTTTTDFEEELGCAWDDFSPVIDWAAFSSSDTVDFLGLVESMMGEDDCSPQPHLHPPPAAMHPCQQVAPVMSGTTTDTSCSSSEGEITPAAVDDEDDCKGLKLIHLLMAAAEALTSASGGSRELARVILFRLKELVSPTAGTNMERLAAYFTDALQGLLDGCCSSSAAGGPGSAKHQQVCFSSANQHPPGDVLTAFQLLQDMSPYVKFGHFTANQAILEAVAGDRRVHIVDYDIMEGIQWASLMQAFVSRKDGAPPPHLRITAITGIGGGGRKGYSSSTPSSIGTVQETGRRLAAFAASIGQPFSFGQCRLDPDEGFRPPAGLKLVKGEALVVNCMLHLPHLSAHRSPDSVGYFLSGARSLNPRLITIVEEEISSGTGPAPAPEVGFVARFMDSLHHYSAVCDSLEAGFPMQRRARALVERVFLGPRIAGAVGRVYRGWGGGGGGEGGSWSEWMERNGFGRVGISFFNHCQARLLVGLFNDGYRVEEVEANKLVLAWKSRRLVSASVWSSSLTSSPARNGGDRSGIPPAPEMMTDADHGLDYCDLLNFGYY